MLKYAADDKPYDEKPLEDESTAKALHEILVAKMKESADKWNGRIDSTLIFVSNFINIRIMDLNNSLQLGCTILGRRHWVCCYANSIYIPSRH